MSKPETQRHMFLSYVQVAIVGTEIFEKKRTIHHSVEDVKGYIQVKPNGNLALRCEHVYIELSPALFAESKLIQSA